jgi:DNA-directed RNA polymerase specialized sigma24 family protein
MSSPDDTVALWVAGLQNGNSDCALRLYREIYDRLVRVSKRRLRDCKLRWADEEDVALSVFESFCQRATQGQFPRLHNRGELWKLLVTITYRKTRHYVRFDRRQKRGGGQIRGESAFLSPTDSRNLGLNAVPSKDDLPADLLLLLAEESERLLAVLGDKSLAQIAIWKMEGHTDAEIATRLGCVERTVERKLQRIREKWSRELS